MTDLISSISNYLKQQEYNSKFFQNIVLVPIVGLVAHVWKRQQLINDLKEINLEGIKAGEYGHISRYNQAARKVMQICNLGAMSVNRGRFSDFALIIASLVLREILPLFSLALFAVGLLTNVARRIILIRDIRLDSNLVKQRPENWLSLGYSTSC